MKRCPGSLSFSQPKPDVVKCPDCGSDVEIWNDEATGACPKCAKTVIRTETQSCVDWCKYAKDCLGEDKYRKYGNMKAAMRKPALFAAMEEVFGTDKKRIEHARKVAAYAEMILARERDAEPPLVLAAAVLHDIGIRKAEEKHGSNEAEYQELEGPPIAKEILTHLGYPEPFIKEVCDIVGHHHHPRPEETVHFKVVYDADMLANTEREWMRSIVKGTGDSFTPELLLESSRQVFQELKNASV